MSLLLDAKIFSYPVPGARAFKPNTFIFSLVLGLVITLMTGAVIAQSQDSTTSRAVAAPVTDDTRYRIGPGDVLAIVVRKAPELSLEAVRVDQQGMINIPMIDPEIKAACKTENELSAEISKLYLEYKRNPSVAVFVREFQSRPVAVIGAVSTPGQFRLQRPVRLLELLSLAGGPSEKAGRIIDIIHTGGPNLCKAEKSETEPVEIQAIGALQLNDVLKGKEGSNPLVQPGDIVSIPEADQIFVIGYVVAPRAIPLKDKQITVTRAVAMAGGPQRDGKTSRIRILRQTDGESKQEIMVDLKAIEKRQAPDIALLPNDIVEVPSSTGKTVLNMLTGAIAPAIANTTLRVIP